MTVTLEQEKSLPMAEPKAPKFAAAEQLASRYAPALLAALLVYAFVRSVVASGTKPYWYDELLTRLVVSRGSWAGMMEAVRAPLDTQPPLFYLVERAATHLVQNQELAYRIPSALAMVVTLLCVYAYVRRARGAMLGLLCAFFCLMTSVFRYFAEEARPYSLLVACTALALVCYQRAERGRWVVLLGCVFALAESLHYLAVLMMVPFGLAELWAVYASRRARWRVWLAFLAGPIALIPWWGILRLNQAYYGPHHVSLSFTFIDISHVYSDFFLLSTPIATAIAFTAILAVVATTEWKEFRTARREQAGEVQEAILLIGLALLPFTGYVFARVTHSGLMSRYVLPGVLGIVLGLGYALGRSSRRSVLLVSAFLVCAVALDELHFWRFAKQESREVANEGKVEADFIESAGYRDLPVVIPNGDVLWMARYAFPNAPERLVYLTDDHDTVDKGMTQAKKYVAMQVWEAGKFAASHARFLVFMRSPDPNLRWITEKHVPAGAKVEQVASDGIRELDLVEPAAR